MMLAALSAYHAGMPQIVVAGPDGRDDTRALLDAVRSRYRPTAILVRVDPGRHDAFSQVLPWIGAMGMRDGRATAYVCREFACDTPTTDPGVVADALDRASAPAR
jgi:uncharacterized protein YyaL (SSP411 family)